MNPELQEKLKAAKTAEELVDLAREEGVELSDEQLETIAGGSDWYEMKPGRHCQARRY